MDTDTPNRRMTRSGRTYEATPTPKSARKTSQSARKAAPKTPSSASRRKTMAAVQPVEAEVPPPAESVETKPTTPSRRRAARSLAFVASSPLMFKEEDAEKENETIAAPATPKVDDTTFSPEEGEKSGLPLPEVKEAAGQQKRKRKSRKDKKSVVGEEEMPPPPPLVEAPKGKRRNKKAKKETTEQQSSSEEQSNVEAMEVESILEVAKIEPSEASNESEVAKIEPSEASNEPEVAKAEPSDAPNEDTCLKLPEIVLDSPQIEEIKVHGSAKDEDPVEIPTINVVPPSPQSKSPEPASTSKGEKLEEEEEDFKSPDKSLETIVIDDTPAAANKPVEEPEPMSDDDDDIVFVRTESRFSRSAREADLNASSVLEKSILKRKRSLSMNDVDELSRKNNRVKFHSPANQTVDLETIDEWMMASFRENNDRTMRPQRRKRSLSEADIRPAQREASRVKAPPNFAAIHQKQFEKLESISEHAARKAKRAHVLTTPNGPTPSANPTRKNLAAIPKMPSLEEAPTKAQKPPTKVAKVGPQPHAEKATTKSPAKSAPTSRFDLGQRTAAHKAMAKSALPPHRAAATSVSESVREHSRVEIQGVRTNRRFELLMKMREKQAEAAAKKS